jgi:hypothetical protein
MKHLALAFALALAVVGGAVAVSAISIPGVADCQNGGC